MIAVNLPNTSGQKGREGITARFRSEVSVCSSSGESVS